MKFSSDSVYFPDGYHIAKATKEDLSEVIGLWTQIRTWQQENKFSVWNPRAENEAFVSKFIENNSLFVLKDNTNQLVGTIIILSEDLECWSNEECNDQEIYLRKLAVNPKFQGQELGKSIINWCKEVAKLNNKNKIRLDCYYCLENYYTNLRFNKVGNGTQLMKDEQNREYNYDYLKFEMIII